ncbi:hypothetical protein K458DRAFT_385420 [Lentithecium fluviatile CBS 122367]|uniref:Uncharacterized protein n=1 Tax=Lentithecium fluviatile CBS 122367 TaxID=1168545 RepID=A0A6G1JCA6_9PLEO|nr:hypothetical protein K458DRAFT_385420 [Lentithecium fluviatile CBS 122367]
MAALEDGALSHSEPSNCTGGSVYFSAHPVDSLLYQNPDLFHDIYVYKCVTTVVFTTGDRGVGGNFSESLERGLEAAYAHMASVPANETPWAETSLQFSRNSVMLRFLRDVPSIQIVYLRLPDGGSDGTGHESSGGDSLKKLYNNDVKSIDTTDGSTFYTLDSLKDLIAAVLKQRAPLNIRVLDFKRSIPEDDEFDGDHADHAISARLVADVVEQNKIEGEVLGYAGSFMRKLDPTLNDTIPDFAIKSDAFFQYAKHDKHMCQTYDGCINGHPETTSEDAPDDVRYVATWLEREYYVS